MNDPVLKESLGTSKLNDVLLKINPYSPTSKFQELKTGSDLTFMQSKIKFCKADFLQTKAVFSIDRNMRSLITNETCFALNSVHIR